MKRLPPLLVKCGITVILIVPLVWWLDARFLLTPDLPPQKVAAYFVQYVLCGWTEQIEKDADALLMRNYRSTGWPVLREQADSCGNEVDVDDLSVVGSSFRRGEGTRQNLAFVEIEATDICFPEDSNEIRDLKFSVSLVAVAKKTPILRRRYERWRINLVSYDPMTRVSGSFGGGKK